MKFVTFEHAATLAPGVLLADGCILDLRSAGGRDRSPAARFETMLDVIESGRAGLERIRAWLDRPPSSCVVRSGDARLKAPLPRPNQIRDFANYELHVRQAIAAALTLRANATGDPAATLAKYRAEGLFEIPKIWYEQPLYFKGNRMSVIGPDEEVIRPSYAKLMDYELELALVIAGPVRDSIGLERAGCGVRLHHLQRLQRPRHAVS